MCHLSYDNSSLIFLFLGLSICSLPVSLSWCLAWCLASTLVTTSFPYLSLVFRWSFILSFLLSIYVCYLSLEPAVIFSLEFVSSSLCVFFLHICIFHKFTFVLKMDESKWGRIMYYPRGLDGLQSNALTRSSAHIIKKKSHLNMYRLGCIIYI